MSGTINLSLSQRFDNETHEPLAGGLLYFIQAGTTSTPQSAYQDSDLTIAYPNPIVLDEGGNVPAFFLADGTIKIRLTNSDGVQQLVADNLQVIGASSGSGGGGTVDATTVLATGDMKIVYGTGTLSGFVRANGRTIGSSTSGATERANADTQALFEYLWTTDANLTVSSGRGASANADWTANKTIALPDVRGRTIAGLDDMGASASTRITSDRFSPSPLTLGSSGGVQDVHLADADLPNTTRTVNGTINVTSNTSTIVQTTGSLIEVASASSGGNARGLLINNSTIGQVGSSGSFSSLITMGNGGAHSNVQPTILMTIYVKL